jgi:hypothetical protein
MLQLTLLNCVAIIYFSHSCGTGPISSP